MASPHDLSAFAPLDASAGLSGETHRQLRSRIVVVPSADSDVLEVASLTSGERWTVPTGQWVKGTGLPTENALCLVVIDDRGDAWVPMWVGM